MKLKKILHDSPHGLKCFTDQHTKSLEHAVSESGGKFYTECVVRKKSVRVTPEEVVRQLFLRTLIDHYGYSPDNLRVEYPVSFGRETKSADIVIMDADRKDTPYIVAEIKKPQERDGKNQLKSYCNATGASMAIWCNGNIKVCYHRKDPNYFEEIRDIPNSSQTLRELLQIAWTLEDLIKTDILSKEGRSLKDVIEKLEDEVLANSGAPIFEEAFKLIFAKLYDEWCSGRDEEARKNRNLEFHNAGETSAQLKDKIQLLFNRANAKWPGVFAESSKIELTPSHLAVCVGSLERVKLFNSNLDVVDDAFEYLMEKESKGAMGQYFTPRYVIDMCVKMLDPHEAEYMIDTASGSSGFPIHAIFHVWKKILRQKKLCQSHLFTIERKPRECEDYVREKVFAMDFDEKAVRVSRALNLIAGDGQTNVLRLNTLDYKRWDETTEDTAWRDTYHEGEKKLRRLRDDKKSPRNHKFDIVMANPPFAGDVRESEIIHLYELGRKMQWRKNIKKPTRLKTYHEKISRHILFIERNLQFLKPGGRMAIVLPQGIFNNISDFPQRYFIHEHCRILAVVGLHGNTFRPHTGTKTSILFVQKWNDDKAAGPLCPRKKDYNIFFATMQKPGKNNSGDKIFVPHPEPEDDQPEFLLDANGHLIPEHDLFNLYEHHFPDNDNETENDDETKIRALLDTPGITEGFLEFAKKEGLSFIKKT